MLQPIQVLADGSRTTPFQLGPVTMQRPFANTITEDTYAVERMVNYEILPAYFLANQRIASRTAFTNYLPYSEAFNITSTTNFPLTTGWTATAVTVTADQTANPADGLVTMDKILETTANSEHSVSQAFTFAATSTVISCFLQGGLGRDFVRIKANDGTTSFTAFFNLTTGVVGTTANCTATIVQQASGIFRCTMVFTPLAAAGNVYFNSSSDGSTVSYVGDATKGFYGWGAQLERASLVGPYIPTYTSATNFTNFSTFSEAFDNAAWTKTSVTVTPNAVANPKDGTVNACSMLEVAATTFHNCSKAIVYTSGQPTALSIFVKAVGRQWFLFSANDGITNFSSYFDLTNGLTGTSSGCTPSIISVGGGWWRCVLLFTPASAGGTIFVAGASANGTNSYLGDITKGYDVWGCQSETASSAGPYVATTTVAVTQSFSFSSSRAISSPDWWDSTMAAITTGDVPDPFCYLVGEADPRVDSTTGNYQFTRTYARIPKDQIIYSTIPLTEPSASSVGVSGGTFNDYSTAPIGTTAPSLGVAYQYAPVVNSANYLFGNNQIYKALIGTSGFGVYPTGGTFTVTFGANTTAALAFNASAATIQTAINGLTSVGAAGITVAVTNNLPTTGILAVTLSVGSTVLPFTISAASLTPAATSQGFSAIQSTISQLLCCSVRHTITAHGFASSGNLAATTSVGSSTTGSYLLTYASGWVVIDANTIAYSYGLGVNLQSFGQLFRAYTPGATRLRSKLTTSFFLPGVTPGITTGTDIPIPARALSDPAFLALAINSPTGFANYDATTLGQWIGSGYEQTVTQIDAATI